MAVAVTSDSRFIISGSEDKSLKVFNFVTKQEIYHFQNAHQCKLISFINQIFTALDSITSIAITSNDKFLISASQDKSIKVFDLHTKQEVYHFKDTHESKIFSNDEFKIPLFSGNSLSCSYL